jgi:hypothetical protein
MILWRFAGDRMKRFVEGVDRGQPHARDEHHRRPAVHGGNQRVVAALIKRLNETRRSFRARRRCLRAALRQKNPESPSQRLREANPPRAGDFITINNAYLHSQDPKRTHGPQSRANSISCSVYSKADVVMVEERAERHLAAVGMGRANSHRPAEGKSLLQRP